jgi:hypothetical protein
MSAIYELQDVSKEMRNKLKEKPMFDNGRILFNGIAKGTPISVYSLDGRLISKQLSSADKAEVPLSSLPKGTYIISVENNKIKVINK